MQQEENEFEIPQVEDVIDQLENSSREFKSLAQSYLKARREYAACFNKITVMIYKAGLHKNGAAFENKIPMLFANEIYSDIAIDTYSRMNEALQEYKGLKMICKAYQAEISGIQSIIKFMQQGEMNEALKNKYQCY